MSSELSVELLDAVSVEPSDIQEEFARCPADIAFWATRYARAIKDAALAKAERERLFGSLLTDQELIASLELRIGKRPSIDQLKGEIENVAEYRAARSSEIDADCERVRLRGVFEAILAKRDCLVSLGAALRAELRSDPQINK